MRRYVVTATYDRSVTSVPIVARDDEHAKIQAYNVITKNHVSDKRWAKGKIELTSHYDSENKIISIPEIKED